MSPESALSEPTLTATSLAYRCVCGKQILFNGNKELCCPTCGRTINLSALDASQTLSFCANVSESSEPSLHLSNDRSGEKLGHFVLESKLGQGGMGAVYRALDQSLRRYVAVKVMRRGSAGGSTAERVNRLLDEAVAQARVNHPNVVTIFYVGCENEEPFFAMELLPGPTLEAELREGSLQFKEVIKYARQVVAALSEASHFGIVHGDIKPSNLIKTSSGAIKLGDFGLAQTEETGPLEGLSGTLSYLAPELIDGHPATELTDRYALGVTLFELTFGRRPHTVDGPTLSAKLLSQRAAEVAFPEKWPAGVPEGWRIVLARLLDKDPCQRYESYDALDRELQALSPAGFTRAGIISRGLAFAIDMVTQLIIMLPLMLPAVIATRTSMFQSDEPRVPWQAYVLMALLPPLVPIAFTWLEWKGWRTPGRYLFQLRVVDSHGLPLAKRRRIVRSVMRNAPVWIGALFAFPTASLGVFDIYLGFVDELFVIINMIPVLGPKRLALHDRLTGSHVVLDTHSSQHHG